MTIEEEKIAKLTDQLNRCKLKAKNRRVAIKNLSKAVNSWQEVAQKFLAMYRNEQKDCEEQRRISWHIAKSRAIEVGLVTEEDCKHIRGITIVRGWYDERLKEYKLQNGII